MAGLIVQQKGALLTVDGSATGFVTLASVFGFYVGAKLILSSTLVGGVEFTVEAIDGLTLGLRAVSSKGYGYTDVSAYLVADGARVDMPTQFVMDATEPTFEDFFAWNGSTLVPSVPIGGAVEATSWYATGLVGTAPSGTGITVNGGGTGGSKMTSSVHKVTVTFANVASGGASLTKDTTIWTIPAKTKVLRVIADITTPFTGGAIASGNLKVGKSVGGNEYLLAGDMFTAPIVLGDALVEEGASLSGGLGDLPSWSATTAISCRFTVAGANVDACTAGSVTFYIETVGYP